MSELTEIMKKTLKRSGSSKEKEEEFILYHSIESDQMLLPETAYFIAVKTYFRMLDLPLTCESRSNAEFLSPNGTTTKVPVLRCGTELVSEFRPIYQYLLGEGHSLWPEDCDPREQLKFRSALASMDDVFINAELYFCWVYDDVRTSITNSRYGCPYEWPLNHIQCWRKLREVKRSLEVDDYLDLEMFDVMTIVKHHCEELSEKLGDQTFFNGKYPTEFDALIFGHLYAILSTNLRSQLLAEEINKKPNLVDFCKNIESTYFKRS